MPKDIHHTYLPTYIHVYMHTYIHKVLHIYIHIYTCSDIRVDTIS